VIGAGVSLLRPSHVGTEEPEATREALGDELRATP
jgi:hypothetical protein